MPDAAKPEDTHIPSSSLPEDQQGKIAPSVSQANIAPPGEQEFQKARRTDRTDEFFMGAGEPEEQPDAPLPDVLALLGAKGTNAIPIVETDGYRTEIIQNAGDINLVWHPTVINGRCELCGATRYVGGQVWKIIDRKTGEIGYKYRGGHWDEIDAAHCPHYRHVTLRCSYCREEFTGAKDRMQMFSEVLGSRVLFVVSEPGRPKVLIMTCSDFTCKKKFNDQFHINAQ